MNSIVKNPEMKSIIIKLLIIQSIFLGIIYMFFYCEFYNLNDNIVNQNSAIMGKILLAHPELEGEIVSYITKGANKEQIVKGKKVLSEYGYYEDMNRNSNPLLKEFYKEFKLKYLLTILIGVLCILYVVFFEYKKMFYKVREISFASEKVMDDDYSVVLPENKEGDFSILAHNFNLMSNRLKLGFYKLKQEKIFLKNILSDISHQLKTPLTSLVTINELLLTRKDMEEYIRIDFLEKSSSQLDRMEWLIINLLKIARLEAGAINFQRKSILAVECIKDALESLKYKSEEKNQNIIINGDLDSVILYVDKQWTTEAILNIIKNCIEHTKKGGEIKIGISETPLFSRVTIEDNGEGIDKKDLPHIFKRFYKGSNSLEAESIGIGLALTKLIVESQGGTIVVTSEKNKGSKFVITFLKVIV
ncbi:sensor histidine kinase [Clostridium rectalis]|uniref:sensor histidine kinase n=1 Tax=Clostridium rectalis TaxID=2040295 RepID=UPI000F62C677|nr:HAMP domain-containing sensor histidine kinase [Clostridium rectalis]